jgi:hypothetical protein
MSVLESKTITIQHLLLTDELYLSDFITIRSNVVGLDVNAWRPDVPGQRAAEECEREET